MAMCCGWRLVTPPSLYCKNVIDLISRMPPILVVVKRLIYDQQWTKHKIFKRFECFQIEFWVESFTLLATIKFSKNFQFIGETIFFIFAV